MTDKEQALEILKGLAVPIHAEPAFDMAIQALEQTQWIPVSERLPEPYNDVLLTICANSAYYGFNINFMKVKCGQYQPQDDKRDWLVDGVGYYFDNVIAWMPLPKPYGKEQK